MCYWRLPIVEDRSKIAASIEESHLVQYGHSDRQMRRAAKHVIGALAHTSSCSDPITDYRCCFFAASTGHLFARSHTGRAANHTGDRTLNLSALPFT